MIFRLPLLLSLALFSIYAWSEPENAQILSGNRNVPDKPWHCFTPEGEESWQCVPEELVDSIQKPSLVTVKRMTEEELRLSDPNYVPPPPPEPVEQGPQPSEFLSRLEGMRYVIQLFASKEFVEAQKYIEKRKLKNIWCVQIKVDDRDWYIVIQGIHDNFDSALDETRAYEYKFYERPWIRDVKGLKKVYWKQL